MHSAKIADSVEIKYLCTAKRILERLGIQTSSSFAKFDRSVFLILKPIFILLVFIWIGFFYLETIGIRLIMI